MSVCGPDENPRAQFSGETAPGSGTRSPVICYYVELLVCPLWYTFPLLPLGRSPPRASSPSPEAREPPGPVFRGECPGPWNTSPRDMLLCEVARFSSLVHLPFISPRPEPTGAPSPSPGARGSPGPVFRRKCPGPWNTFPRDMLVCEVARFFLLVPLPFTSPRPEPTRGPFPEPGGPEYGRYPSARGPGRARLARSGGDGGSLKNSACPRSVASVIPS